MKVAALVSISLALLLAGCDGSKSSSDTTTSSSPAAAKTGQADNATFKVALLTPGPVNDAGWSAMPYERLIGIKIDMRADVSSEYAEGEGTIRDAMRTYAQKRYNLVFGHGYEYNAPGVELAKDFPNTVFVSSSGDKTAKNAGAFRFELEQGFYLAG